MTTTTLTDGDLLRAYAADRSDAAFAELVRRYAPMVLAAADRMAPGLSDDVAQAVFVALATKAATLDGRHLAGWLHRAAGHAARHAARTAARRRRHESLAARPEVAPMPMEPAGPSPEQLADLHAALGRLSNIDRSSVLHRFARGLSFAAVGRELGVGEEAARKRVARAVVRLRRLMRTPELADTVLATALVRPASDRLLTQLAAAAHAAHSPSVVAAANAVAHGLQRAKLLATAAAATGLAAAVAVVGWIALAHSLPPPPVSINPVVHPTTSAAPPPARAAALSSPPPERRREPSSPISGEPPLSPGPAQVIRLRNQVSMANANDIELVNGGNEMVRAGGELHNGPKPHFTGTTVLDAVSLPSGGRKTAINTAGFPVFKAAFTPDGQRAIYSTIDWNETGQERLFVADLSERGVDRPALLSVGPNWFGPLAITADGHRAAVALSSTKFVQLWDVDARRLAATIDVGSGVSILGGLAFDPTGRYLLTGLDGSGVLRIWDAATGKPLAQCVGHTGDVRLVAVAPDGTVAASADSDGAIWLWSMPSGQGLARVEFPTESIEKLAFSADGKRLVAASSVKVEPTKANRLGIRCKLRVWDVPAMAPLARFETDTSPVQAVAFRPDSRTLLSTTGYLVDVWKMPDGMAMPSVTARAAPPTQPTDGEVARFPFAYGASVAFSPDGHRLYAGSSSWMNCWDLATGTVVASVPSTAGANVRLLRPGQNRAVGISYEALASGKVEEFANVIDLSTGSTRTRVGSPDAPNLAGLDLSPDGSLLALARNVTLETQAPPFSPRVELVGAADGKSVCRVPQGVEPVRCVAFSPDGRRLYVGGGRQDGVTFRDCVVRAVSVDTGADIATYSNVTEVPRALAPSADGRKLWAITDWGTVSAWDVATGRELAHIKDLGQAFCIAVSPDGRTVAVGLGTHSIAIIDATTGTLRRLLRPHAALVMAVAFSPDSARLASASADNTVRVWDLRAQP